MSQYKQPIWRRDNLHGPYVIAEAGVNHNGRFDLARQLIDAAKSSGADCIKFQAYTAAELVTSTAGKAAYQENCGSNGETQYEMLCRYELHEDDYYRLNDHARQCGIDFLVTPFSVNWVNVLQEMGVGAIKIGSGNLNMLQLLQAIARSGLDTIVSTGMSDLTEIETLIETLQANGCGQIALLHCVSLYPTPLDQANLYAIDVLRKRFHLPTGFSDHTEEIQTGGLAVAAGAVILEKHFTLDQSQDGPDHAMSLSPAQLKVYIDFARDASKACGQRIKRPHAGEAAIKEAVRTSLVARRPIKAGHIITADMLTEKRPGTGIASDRLEQVIGASLICDIAEDQVLQEHFFTHSERVKV